MLAGSGVRTELQVDLGTKSLRGPSVRPRVVRVFGVASLEFAAGFTL